MQESPFTVAGPEGFAPVDHPARPFRDVVNPSLKHLGLGNDF